MCAGFCLTIQFKDSEVRPAVHGSDSIPTTARPQALEHPGGSDDRGGPAGALPIVGDGSTDDGA